MRLRVKCIPIISAKFLFFIIGFLKSLNSSYATGKTYITIFAYVNVVKFATSIRATVKQEYHERVPI